MYYCETSNRPIPHPAWLSRRKISSSYRRKASVSAFLKAMVAPENTTPPIVAGTSEHSWFGPVKTLFWIANALAIAMILAKLC